MILLQRLLLGVYEHWTGLLEWWNTGMVDWIVFFFVFHYLMHCIFPVVFTPTSHVHTHNSTWLMVLYTDECIEILGLNKAT